jgi:hypothetical protein
MMKRLQTVDQILDAFGGAKRPADNNKTIASWLGLNTSAVCNWRERNNIPSGWHMRFYLEAEKRGMKIDPRVFGVEDEAPSPVKKKRPAPSGRRAAESQAA